MTGTSIILVAWAASLGLGLSRRVPRWLPWIAPAGLAAYYIVAYEGELHPESGDGQPNLTAVVGTIVVLISVLLTWVGLFARRRGTGRR